MTVTYIPMYARDFYNCTHVCSNNHALMYSLPTNSLCAGVVILKSSTHTSHTCPIHSGHQSLCLFTHVDTIHCSLWAAKQGKSERAIAMKWHCINLCMHQYHPHLQLRPCCTDNFGREYGHGQLYVQVLQKSDQWYLDWQWLEYGKTKIW